jgi:hypothetical protein
MHLLPDWRAILARAWSVRFIVLAIVLEGSAEILKFMVDSGPVSPGMRIAAAGAMAMAVASRIVSQENLSGGK